MIPGIRLIAQYIANYYFRYCNAGYLVIIIAMLVGLFYQHYTGLAGFSSPPAAILPQWLRRYALYSVPFIAAYLLQPLFFGQKKFLHQKRFWILVLMAPAFFTFRVQFDLSTFFSPDYTANPANRSYSTQLLIRSLVLILPTASCWYYMDRQASHGYGLRKTVNLPMYFLLILLMLPLLSLASFNPAFLEQYPRAFKAIGSSHPGNLAQWLYFELVYAFNFLSIEFFFRAFLILAFIRLSGPHAIIPAACFYCCIHLDKPLAEAISSFFGGWLLGIICYYSKSIWGGFLIHVGIAWLMELFAWLQHQ